jgi:hypothetical protein
MSRMRKRFMLALRTLPGLGCPDERTATAPDSCGIEPAGSLLADSADNCALRRDRNHGVLLQPRVARMSPPVTAQRRRVSGDTRHCGAERVCCGRGSRTLIASKPSIQAGLHDLQRTGATGLEPATFGFGDLLRSNQAKGSRAWTAPVPAPRRSSSRRCVTAVGDRLKPEQGLRVRVADRAFPVTVGACTC